MLSLRLEEPSEYETHTVTFLSYWNTLHFCRGREDTRKERVAKADADGVLCVNCEYCDWREVKQQNIGYSIGAHRRSCSAYAEYYRSRGGAEQLGTYDDFCCYPGDAAEEVDESIEVVHEENCGDYIIQRSVHPVKRTTNDNKKHQERMRILDDIRQEDERQFVDCRTTCEDIDADKQMNSEDVNPFMGPFPDKDGIEATSSTHVFEHQVLIERILSDPLPDMRGKKSPEATVALLDLGFSMNISERNGDLLLAYLKEYSSGVFFTKWRGVKDAFNRQFKDVCKLQQLDIPLPPEFFGAIDCEGQPLKPVSCFFYNILLRLGEACLEINPDDFTAQYTTCDRVKGTEERIFNTFPKAKLFQRFTFWTKSTHGEKATCIVVAIYYDAALATMSRSFCPLIMFILNCTGKSFRPIFIGYCPIDLAYTDESLTKILHSKSVVGKPAKRSIKYAIRFAKRQALQQFLVHVLSPILESSVNGLKLQIGSDKTQTKYRPVVIYAIVHLGNFIGDSAALHDLASVKMGCKECRCRICTCSNLACFGTKNRNFTPRSSKLMYALTHKLGEIELYKFRRSCGIQVDLISNEEKELRTYCERLSARLGVIGGGNGVIALWEPAESAKVFSFYLALVIDYLHTLWKGICEFAASGVLQIAHCISRHWERLGLDPKYQFAKANLDERLSRWAGLNESFHPVRLVHLEKVTDLLKADAKDQKGKERTTGVIRGCFPAWQMPNLCLQLIFGIGCEGSVIPNEMILISNDVMDRYGNPTTISLKSLSGVLEVAFFCEANSLTETQLHIMAERIDSACLNLVDLHDLKMKLFRRTMPLKPKSLPGEPLKKIEPPKKYEFPRNVKTHSTTHFPQQIRFFGAFSGAINSSLGEASHKMNVTEAFGRSSTILATSAAQMARHTLRKELARRQMQFCLKTCATVDDLAFEDEDEELEADGNNNTVSLRFHAIVQHGSVDLQPRATDDMLEPVTREGQRGDKFMHPLLERKELYTLLVKASKSNAWINSVFQQWNKGSDPEVKIRLFGGVKCEGHTDAGVAPFILRATRGGRGDAKYRAAFNSCEISYEQDNFSFGKILALVGFQGRNYALPGVCPIPQPDLQLRLWVAVARYEKEIVVNRSFPFNTFKFEATKRGGRLSLDFVEIHSIHRPCFMTISSDAVRDLRLETQRNYTKMRWFCIPFDRAVKTENFEYEDSETLPFATPEDMEAKLIELDLNHDYDLPLGDISKILGKKDVLVVEEEQGDTSESDEDARDFFWESDGES